MSPLRPRSTSSRSCDALLVSSGHALGSGPRTWPLGTFREPDGVLAASVRAQVEPAVAGDDLEARSLEEAAPLVGGDPGERHGGLRLLATDPQGEDAALEVPVGPLPDAGLALEPPAVRLLDVVGARGEDVEDEAPAGNQQTEGRSEEHTSELQSRLQLVCRLLLEKKKRRNS